MANETQSTGASDSVHPNGTFVQSTGGLSGGASSTHVQSTGGLAQ